MTFTIKQDNKDILNTLIHFKKDIFDKSITDKQLEAMADKFAKYAVFIVASDEGVDVGYISFYCNDTLNKNAFISMIIVGSEFHGKGYGRKLMERTIEMAQKAGMYSVKLEVSRDNRQALGFYDRLGFVLSNQLESSYILEKTI